MIDKSLTDNGNEFVGSKAEAVTVAIMEERQFQNQKHGTVEDVPHSLGEWVLLIEAELEEAKRALIKGGSGRDSVRSELIQVAALVFACLEQHGTVDTHNGRQI